MATTEERVVLTAELKDELSAPLDGARRKIVETTQSATKAVQDHADATAKAMASVTNVLEAGGTSTSRLGRVYSQFTQNVSNGWGTFTSLMDGHYKVLGDGLGTLAGDIARDTNDLVGKVSEAGAAIGEKLSEGLGEATKAVTLFGAGVIAVASEQVHKALETGFERISTIQEATGTLNSTLHDTAKSAALVQGITDAVQGTPFNLDQFMEGGKTLAAFGMDAKKIPGYLTAIGEAATMNGSGADGVGQMIEAIGRAQSAGNIYMDTINSFSDNGVNALTILANAYGLTGDAMQKMISKGMVPADKAMDILKKGILEGSKGVAGVTVAMAGNMEDARNSLSGSLGGMAAARARFGAAMLVPFMDTFDESGKVMAGPFTKIVQSVTVLWNAMTKEFAGAAKQLADMGIIEKVTGWINNLADGLHAIMLLIGHGQFTRQLREIFNIEEDNPLVRTILAIRKHLDELKLAIYPMVGAFMVWQSSILHGLPVIGELIPELSPLFGIFMGLVAASPQLRDALETAFKSIVSWAQTLWPTIKTVAEYLWQLFSVVLDAGIQIIPVLVSVFEELAGKIINDLIPALYPVISIVGQLLVDAFHWLADAIPPTADALGHIIDGFVDFVKWATPGLKVLGDWAGTLLNVVGPGLPGIVLGLYGLWKIIGLVTEGIRLWKLAEEAWLGIQVGIQLARGVSTALTEAETRAMEKSTFAMLMKTAATWGLFDAQVALATITAVLEALGGGWVVLIVAAVIALVAYLIWAYNNVGWFKDGVDAAVKWIGEAWNAMCKWIGEAWDNTIKWIGEAWSNVGHWFSDTIGMFVDFFNNTVGMVTDWVNNTVGMFTDFDNNTRGMFDDFFSNTVGMFVDFFNNTMGMFNDFWGNWNDWWAKFCKDPIGMVHQFIKDVWKNFEPFFTQTMGMFDDFNKNTNGMFMDFFANTLGMFVDFGNNTFGMWNDFVANTVGMFVDFFNNTIGMFVDFFNNTVGMFVDFGNNVAAHWDEFIANTEGMLIDFSTNTVGMFVDFFNNTIGMFVDFFNNTVGMFVDFGNNIAAGWQQFVDNTIGMLTDFNNNTNGMFMDFFNNTGGMFVDFFNNTVGMFVDFINNTVGMVVDWVNGIVGMFQDWRNMLTGETRTFVDNTVGMITDFVNNTIGMFTDFVNNTIGMFTDIGTNIAHGFQPLVDFWNSTLGPIFDAIGGGLGAVGKAVSDFFGGGGNGGGNMPTGGTGGSGGMVVPYKFAGGGVIPGYAPGVDNFNATLSPGESVLVPELTKAIGGANIMALNHAYSNGRKAGAGPAPVAMNASRGGGSISVGDISVTVASTDASPADIGEAVRQEVLNVVDEIQRRNY